MRPDLVLAIDLGSSWCKAAYIDRRGEIAAEGRTFTRSITEQVAGGWLDQFWRAVVEAAQRAGAGLNRPPRPDAVAISCRGLFGIGLDQDGQAFITSSDILALKRSPEAAAAFQSPVWGPAGPYGYGYAVRLAGLVAGLRTRSPGQWRRIHRVGALLNYIVYRLCGEWVTDPSTGPSGESWPSGLMELSGLPVTAFPAILDPWAVAGNLSPNVAENLALPAGIPVVAGLHDGAAANIGTGALAPGDTCLTLGTNFALRVVTGDRPPSRCFGYVVAPGRWAWVNNVSGVSPWLDRVATTLLEHPADLAEKHGSLGEMAAAVSPGARLPPLKVGDVISIPGLRGVGDWGGSSPGEIYLAALRAAADGVRCLVERAQRCDAHARRFVVTGGSARNEHLLRVLAATLGQPIQVGHPEAGLLGAGMVAAIGAGWYGTLAEAWGAMAPATSIVPSAASGGVETAREVWT
jgi:sugar (pentulose or hexulose) kinase